jgi:ariadne-1
VEGDPYLEPECGCGTTFCFKCGGAPHSPCTCHMWRLWDEKTSGDSETKNWMMANTKPCPNCSEQRGCPHPLRLARHLC